MAIDKEEYKGLVIERDPNDGWWIVHTGESHPGDRTVHGRWPIVADADDEGLSEPKHYIDLAVAQQKGATVTVEPFEPDA